MMTEESLLANINSMKRDAALCNKKAGFGVVPLSKYQSAQKHKFPKHKFKPKETWEKMQERHRLEILDVVIQMNQAGYSQAEAARELEMSPRHLNNYVIRNKINWLVKKR